jgi:hypothetical protein
MFHRCEERAAIREFGGGEPRDVAEREALLELSAILDRSLEDIITEWLSAPELAEATRRLGLDRGGSDNDLAQGILARLGLG